MLRSTDMLSLRDMEIRSLYISSYRYSVPDGTWNTIILHFFLPICCPWRDMEIRPVINRSRRDQILVATRIFNNVYRPVGTKRSVPDGTGSYVSRYVLPICCPYGTWKYDHFAFLPTDMLSQRDMEHDPISTGYTGTIKSWPVIFRSRRDQISNPDIQ